MAAPWEKYQPAAQQTSKGPSGPWGKYAQSPAVAPSAPTPVAAAIEGHWTDNIRDPAAAVAKIPLVAAKGVTDIARLLTNDGLGADSSNWLKDAMESVDNTVGSERLRAQKDDVSRILESDEFTIADIPGMIADNPRAALDAGISTIGSMLLPSGVAVGAVRGAGALANAGRVGAAVSKIAPTKLATGTAIGTGAAMNAGETFSDTEGSHPADRYKGAAISGATSLVLGKLLGGGAEGLVARRFAGELGKDTVAEIAKSAGKTAVKEGLQEFGEEGSNTIGKQVGKGEDINLNAAAKSGAYGAAIGTSLGATTDVATNARALKNAPQQGPAIDPNAPPVDEPAAPRESLSTRLDAMADRMEAEGKMDEAREYRVRAQTAKLVEADPEGARRLIQEAQSGEATTQQADTSAQGQAPAVMEGAAAQQGLPAAGTAPVEAAGLKPQEGPILQNRDRSTTASVAQMQSIAADPDYGRLGYSRDFANGAPVVAGGQAQHLGRTDYATASDGRRIPVQYAVVEADSVLSSNAVDGTPNQAYGTNTEAMRAIAGNGRIAGLQAAAQRGSNAKYKQELMDDSLHGIDPQVIAGMRAPVLVRVMPQDQVTDNIGDISNTSGNLSLSAVEQAANDGQRVDLSALEFAEDGGVTANTVRQFVQGMPQAEIGQLLDTNGQPTKQAVDRLNAAVFSRAYGNDQLVRLYAQAQDPEARLILSALAKLAPKMARLEGAGALDIRPIVTQAAEIAVNARRNGTPLAQAAQQLDMAADPAVGVVLDLFAQNPRSNKHVIEQLGNAADFAYTEANKDGTDMFGEVPRASRDDVINQIGGNNERASTQAVEQPAGSSPVSNDAQGASTQQAAPADTGPAETSGATDALTRYTAEEVTARQDAQAKAEADQARADREAEQRAKADREVPEFTLTGSDRSADANPNQGDIFSASSSPNPIHEKQTISSRAKALGIKGVRNGMDAEKAEKVIKPYLAGERAKNLIGAGKVSGLPQYKDISLTDARAFGSMVEANRYAVDTSSNPWVFDGRGVAEADRMVAAGLLFESDSRYKHELTPVGMEVAKKLLARTESNLSAEAMLSELEGARRSEGEKSSTGNTTTDVRSALSKRFGNTIQAMERRGFLKLWDSYEQFLDGSKGLSTELMQASGVQGMYDGKTVHMFADGIANGDEVGVFLHEAGEHASMEAMLGGRYAGLVKRAHELVRDGDADALAAQARIPADTAEAVRDSELLAYMIENVANKKPLELSAKARKWLADVIAAIRAWWYQTGFNQNLEKYGRGVELTPADIAALAVRAVYWGERNQAGGGESSSRLSVQDRSATGGNANALQSSSAPWTVAEPGTRDAWVRALQNNKIDLKRVRDVLEEKYGKLSDRQDAYLNEELYHGRVAARVTQLHDEVVKPILAKIAVAGKNTGVTVDDVNLYLHARHAPERNAAMKEINPDMANNEALSGMSDQEAASAIARLRADGKLGALQKIAADIDGLIGDTRASLVADGLEDADVVAAWESKYKHYVPLQRDFQEQGSGATKGMGFSVRGPEAKRAVGSNREVVNILANIVASAETAAIRAEKSRVGRSLLEMAQAHPNKDFWTVDTPPTKPRINKDTGLVERNAVDPLYQTADNVLMLKDQNGHQHFVVFNEKNERAMAVAKAMKNIDVASVPKAIEIVGKGTRFLASMLTARNPEFWVTNFARDIQGALLNLEGTSAEGLQKSFLKNMGGAFKGMHSLVRGDGSGPMAKAAREMMEAGGTTGYMQQFENSDARMGDLRKEIARMQQGKADPRRLARAALEFIEDYNDIIENAVRLAAYKTARDAGASVARSASLAKNITVNFNRKGNQTPLINSLYMFFNASIQGTARMLQAITTSKKAQAFVGAIAGLGFVLDMANRMIAGEDDETGRNRYDMIPEFEKSKNWIFMNPMEPGKYVKVPLPLGPHIFHNAGRLVSDAANRKDKRNTSEYAFSFAGMFFDAFSPLGGAQSLSEFIAPSVFDPAIQLENNKSFTGAPVYKSADQGFGNVDPKPAFTRHFESTPDLWVAASRALNSASGGDDVKPGAVNIEPDILKHIAYTFTGGPGRSLDQTADMVQGRLRGEEVNEARYPFVRRFYGANDDQQRSRIFYDDQKRVNEAKTQFDYFNKQGRRDLAKEVATELGDGNYQRGLKLMRDYKGGARQLQKINEQIKREQLRHSKGEDRTTQLKVLRDRRNAVMAGTVQRATDQDDD